MSETLHPADEIPGGLWDGAWVECRAGADQLGARIRGPVVHRFDALGEEPASVWIGGYIPSRSNQPQDRVSLILPGPLGLGLAGLAASVAGRLLGDSYASCLLSGDLGERPFRDHLESLDWFPGAPQHEVPNPWYELTAAASYLARTDRLCALVGLTLEPGEVARWERWPEGGGWTLSAMPGGQHWFADNDPGDGNNHHHVVASANADDPLEALRVCVAALEADDDR